MINTETTLVARQILLDGGVQGFGVRPAIAKLALRLQLHGWVVNTADGVLIQLEGFDSAIEDFCAQLASELPLLPHFQIHHVISVPVAGLKTFHIREQPESGVTAVDVPADRAMCRDCHRELTDPSDRRFGYAFSSCTACGPRYSIIRSMPYDRHDTAMAAFRLCAACETEYRDLDNRRCHAQTIACAECGPRLWFESAATSGSCTGQDAIFAAAEIVRTGGVLALKGIGGYQLLCDAANAAAVKRLRERKQRPSKPFAIMLRHPPGLFSPAASEKVADWPDEGVFTSPSNPILISEKTWQNPIASNVSPRMNSLGVMLPTTPLHALLLDELKTPLVVTSGNRESEPLVFTETAARRSLEGIADGWLHHDREIERPVDDSVVRVIAGRPVTIRAARGIAPLRLPFQTRHSILAVGGQQKVACALSNSRQVVLGPHIGDMTSTAVRQRFVEQTCALQELYGALPTVIAHDLHPDYFTSRWAADQGHRTIAVQHHHAHIVSGMLQQELLDERVLGVAFDGTGYGTDGTIWGGEFLLATRLNFERVASLRPLILPGGEAAIREPWRVAVALLDAAVPQIAAREIFEFLHRQAAITDRLYGTPETLPTLEQIRNVQHLVRSRIGPQTSSMGRIFDGVASLVFGMSTADFEGAPAMFLEAVCDHSESHPFEQFPDTLLESSTTAPLQIDWRPVVHQVFISIQAGDPVSLIAHQFHRAMARATGLVAQQFPEYPVVLSGGCFQNRLLTELTMKELEQQSRRVVPPGTIPPNDGGLAAGQLAIAAAILESEEIPRTAICA
ncbi:MAG: carbamoyltransferase HypF [Planctomycetaceae bacterium]|nr:carbamoyltransferase HypF [Planctomycetaceae bacterium]